MWARRVQQHLYRWTYRPAPQTRIAMFHAGRCGSSVLADLLNQRTEIHWANEIFENMQPAFYNMSANKRAQARIAAMIHPPVTPYFGFETKYLPEQHLRYELANSTPQDYVQLLEKMGFSHFVLLDRQNHLRRAISIAIGTKTNQWSSLKSTNQVTTVSLNPEQFVSYGETMPLLKFFKSLETRYAEVKQAIGNRPLLEINYEEDIMNNPLVAYEKVCDFLGLPIQDKSISVRLRKQNPTPISDLLENYSEICAYLGDTEYAWMLSAD